MSTIKEELTRLIHEQPDDSSPDEIVRELAFHVMVERGLADSDTKRTRGYGPTHSLMVGVSWTEEAQHWFDEIKPKDCLSRHASKQVVSLLYLP